MEALKVMVLEHGLHADLDSALESIRSPEGAPPLSLLRPEDQDPGSLEARLGSMRPDMLFLHCTRDSRDAVHDIVGRVRRVDGRLPVLAAVQELEQRILMGLLETGVTDFVVMPLRPLDLIPRMLRLGARFRGEDPALGSLKEKMGLRRILGEDARFLGEIRKIPAVAGCDATVLIQGETGTGKELCARAVHYLSPRADMPFVPVNCGAIPPELVENELFGHEREAFTGAAAARPGLIREASGGTLFLDEVDSLPLLVQVKLLRFLQEKEYRPLGATKTCKADVRVVAASNAELEAAVEQGRLRRDLYYRLNVVSVRLPPLRERKSDIPRLARHFLAKYRKEYGKENLQVSEAAFRELEHHPWPGNVRELEHVVQRAVLLSGDSLWAESLLPAPEKGDERLAESLKAAKARLIRDFERQYIRDLLAEHGGNISHAAQSAGKNRRAFWQLIRKYGITADDFRDVAPARGRSAHPA